MFDVKETIARQVAKEIKDGDVVNLGIGLPTLTANYIPKELDVTLQSENGFVGLGGLAEKGRQDPNLVNAGGQYVELTPGGAFFDSAMSFGLIRGGHVDVTVLGAMEVDEKGNLANWCIPGKLVPGMGGAMDLVVGAKKVIIAMQHTNRGKAKILKKCFLPLTAVGVVDLIITEMGVIEVGDKGLVLREINPQFSIEEVKGATEAKLTVSPNLKKMRFEGSEKHE